MSPTTQIVVSLTFVLYACVVMRVAFGRKK